MSWDRGSQQDLDYSWFPVPLASPRKCFVPREWMLQTHSLLGMPWRVTIPDVKGWCALRQGCREEEGPQIDWGWPSQDCPRSDKKQGKIQPQDPGRAGTIETRGQGSLLWPQKATKVLGYSGQITCPLWASSKNGDWISLLGLASQSKCSVKFQKEAKWLRLLHPDFFQSRMWHVQEKWNFNEDQIINYFYFSWSGKDRMQTSLKNWGQRGPGVLNSGTVPLEPYPQSTLKNFQEKWRCQTKDQKLPTSVEK
jgi:hypothetical protein